MRIVSVGGGPAGLYTAILMKQAWPEATIEVFERNRADDTFGWGVVFSDETLGNFEAADAPSYKRILENFRYWRDIETFHQGTRVVSTGHGFAALSRRKLLLILQERCLELGVDLRFECEVDDPESLLTADLVIGADGINSLVRQRWEDRFRPHVDWRRCRFCWLGTDKPLEAFTFHFKPSPHGLFQVHAYPFEDGLCTWIVECREEVWRRAGLDTADEEGTVAFCEDLFEDELGGHRLLTNRSLWRAFPTVRCEQWHFDNVVLLGDAVHTAHFSIGSGTKLAMEDAIALSSALERHGQAAIPQALAAYQDERWVDVIKLQKAAQTSLEWFENSARYLEQPPVQFTFNLMTRSKRITYDNLKERDPALIERLNELFPRLPENASDGVVDLDRQESDDTEPISAELESAEALVAAKPEAQRPGSGSRAPIFTLFRLRELTLLNRIVVSPMCQYSAVEGMVGEWHQVHYGSRAIGGAGLVMTEMTDVQADGRITHGCAGLYRQDHMKAWRRIVDFAHAHSSAAIGIQLAHAGRKGSALLPWEADDVPLTEAQGAWSTQGPSALPFAAGWPAPRAMEEADMDRVQAAFVRATRWAEEAGFDLLELHMAHGYLLSSFISPLSNQRDDSYGGSLENRMRFPLRVFAAMRAIWPAAKPMSVRISASDWMADGSGVTPDEAVEMSRLLKAAGCDIIDVSSAGNVPDSEVGYGRMYQVPFAERIRCEAGIPVMAVGAILGADHANTVIAAGRADLTAMARPHLADPYLTLHAAERYEHWDQPWPPQYLAAKPRPRDE